MDPRANQMSDFVKPLSSEGWGQWGKDHVIIQLFLDGRLFGKHL
jgi:hypothetical protein